MSCARRSAGARKPAPSTSAGSPSRPDLHSGRSRARLFHLPALALLLSVLSQFAAAPASADVLVSNFKETRTAATFGNNARAQGFTTGDGGGIGDGGGYYILESIELNRFNRRYLTADELGRVRAQLWSADTNGAPDSKIVDLTVTGSVGGVSVQGGTNKSIFNAPAGTRLQPATTYHIVIFTTSAIGNGQQFRLGRTSGDQEDAGAASGWSIADNSYWTRSSGPTGTTSWTSWSDSLVIRVIGREVPPLSVTATPACGSTVSDLSVQPKWQLKLTPAPSREVAMEFNVVDAGGTNLAGAWQGTHPIRTSGFNFESLRDSSFAHFRNAFPGFAGFAFRFRDRPSTTVRCTWQFDNTGNGGGTTTPTNTGNSGSGSGGGTNTVTNTGGGSGGGNSGSGGSGSGSSGGGGGSSGGGGGGSSGGGGGRPALSSNAALSDLVATPRDEDGNQGKRLSLSPAFAPSTTAYTLDVPYTTGTLDIMPGLTSGTAAVGTRRDGTTSAFPAADTYTVHLRPGETTVIEVTVTAENRRTTRTYTLTVTRAAPNTDPSLPALVVNGNDKSRINLSPAFSPDNTDYEASLAYAVNAVTFTPTTRNTGARVRIGGREVPGGQASAPVPLAVGSNAITLTVTAEDGITTRAYTLTLARAGADAEPPAADPRALPDLSRALADDTQHSIATRLATARAPAPGRTARSAPGSAPG